MKNMTEQRANETRIDNLIFKLKKEFDNGESQTVIDSLKHILGVEITEIPSFEYMKAKSDLDTFILNSGCDMPKFSELLKNYTFWFNHYFQQGKIKMELPT